MQLRKVILAIILFCHLIIPCYAESMPRILVQGISGETAEEDIQIFALRLNENIMKIFKKKAIATVQNTKIENLNISDIDKQSKKYNIDYVVYGDIVKSDNGTFVLTQYVYCSDQRKIIYSKTTNPLLLLDTFSEVDSIIEECISVIDNQNWIPMLINGTISEFQQKMISLGIDTSKEPIISQYLSRQGEESKEEIVRKLIQLEANVNAEYKSRSPIEIAVSLDNEAIIKTLISESCKIKNSRIAGYNLIDYYLTFRSYNSNIKEIVQYNEGLPQEDKLKIDAMNKYKYDLLLDNEEMSKEIIERFQGSKYIEELWQIALFAGCDNTLNILSNLYKRPIFNSSTFDFLSNNLKSLEKLTLLGIDLSENRPDEITTLRSHVIKNNKQYADLLAKLGCTTQ